MSCYYFDNSLPWKVEVTAGVIWPPSTPHPPKRPPSHPSASWLITSLWGFLIPYTHLTAIRTASQGQHEIPEMWSWLAVPGTVVHSGKNLPVVFSPIGSLCRGRRKICRGFGGMWPSWPTCSLSSQREAAACPQSTLSPAQELKDLTVLPGALQSKAAWRSRIEDPSTSKIFIHSKQLLQRNLSGTRVNHTKLLNPNEFEFKTNFNRIINWTCLKKKKEKETRLVFFTYILLHRTLYNTYVIFLLL